MTPAMMDARVRHDFKNQLAIIRGFAEIMLADAAEGDVRRRDLEEIYKAAVNALALLDRLYPAAADQPGDPAR
jgi:signal transduction histidine kinase